MSDTGNYGYVRRAEPAPQPVDEERRHPFIADAVPAGVAGFAFTVFMLGLYNTGWFDTRGLAMVVVTGAVYGGLTQFIAGWFAIARGDAFPGAFMTSYGAFWFGYAGIALYVGPHAGPATGQAIAIYLALWTVITLIYTVAALATNWMVVSAFVTLDIALILVTIGAALPSTIATEAGGYVEMLLGAIVWYIVLAELARAGLKGHLFPLFPVRQVGVTPSEHLPERGRTPPPLPTS